MQDTHQRRTHTSYAKPSAATHTTRCVSVLQEGTGRWEERLGIGCGEEKGEGKEGMDKEKRGKMWMWRGNDGEERGKDGNGLKEKGSKGKEEKKVI